MWKTETFSDSKDLAVINEYDKNANMEISTVLGHVYDVPCQRIFSRGLFRHLYDYVFGVRNFEITKSMSIIFFVKMLIISSRFQNQHKIWRKSFWFLR